MQDSSPRFRILEGRAEMEHRGDRRITMSVPSKLEHMNSETCVNKAAIIINLSTSYYSLSVF